MMSRYWATVPPSALYILHTHQTGGSCQLPPLSICSPNYRCGARDNTHTHKKSHTRARAEWWCCSACVYVRSEGIWLFDNRTSVNMFVQCVKTQMALSTSSVNGLYWSTGGAKLANDLHCGPEKVIIAHVWSREDQKCWRQRAWALTNNWTLTSHVSKYLCVLGGRGCGWGRNESDIPSLLFLK